MIFGQVISAEEVAERQNNAIKIVMKENMLASDYKSALIFVRKSRFLALLGMTYSCCYSPCDVIPNGVTDVDF